MDAYEKLFLKLETEKKQSEKEEAKKEISEKSEEEKPSDKIQDGIKSPDNIEVEKKLTDETEAEKKPSINTEEEVKPLVNMEDEEKPLEETKASPWLPFWQTTFNQLAEEEESNKELSKKLIKFTGSIYIKSKPSKAKIYLDGAEIGTTPDTLKTMNIGPHEIEIKAEGYTPWKKSININKGKNKKVNAVLQINTDSVNIKSKPSDAKALIDDNEVGDTPVTLTDLKPGMGSSGIKMEGDENLGERVDIIPDKDSVIAATLQMKTGSVSIKSEPQNAKVLIADKEVGTTPVTIADLMPGTFNVEVIMDGYEGWKKSINVISDKEISLTVALIMKPNDQLKVFKFAKDISTGAVIPDFRLKEGQLRNHVLIVDHNLDEKNFKDKQLSMIKEAGIDYLIAPDSTKDLYKIATGAGLHLIKCSDAELINEGNKIEISLKEGLIFDFENGQEYKLNSMTNTVRKCTVHKTRLGDCLLIGDDLKINVVDIDKDQIKICVNALKVVTIYLNKSTPIYEKIKIGALKIKFDQVNLVIEAPEGITINRE